MVENILLQELREYLVEVIRRIDSGECKISSRGTTEVIGVIKKYTDTSREFTKSEASDYLRVSTSTFDRMVKTGKIPKGHKSKGHRVLTWSTSDLDKVL